MGRFDRYRALINVRSGTIILSCALVFSLLSSSSTAEALAVEPLADTVISIAKLDESGNVAGNDNGRGFSKTEHKVPVSSSAHKAPDMTVQQSTGDDTVTSNPALVVELMEQLPSINTAQIQLQAVRMYRPVSTLTVAHAVSGTTTTDSVMPLQASGHGWQIFGIAWYWWLLSCFVVFVSSRILVGFYFQRLRSLNTKNIST